MRTKFIHKDGRKATNAIIDVDLTLVKSWSTDRMNMPMALYSAIVLEGRGIGQEFRISWQGLTDYYTPLAEEVVEK